MRTQIDVYMSFDLDADKWDTLSIEDFLSLSVRKTADEMDGALLSLVVFKDVAPENEIVELCEALGQSLDWVNELITDDSEEIRRHNEKRWQRIQSVYARFSHRNTQEEAKDSV